MITGASGFIGQQVLKELRKYEFELFLVTRGKRLEQFGGDNYIFVQTEDLFQESTEWWRENLSGIDTILHLAWFTSPGRYIDSEENLACLNGSIRLAEGAALAGVRRIIGIGTCVEYEMTGNYLDVNTPLKPHNLYGASKAALFLTLSNFLPMKSIEFAWCRLFYVYGEHESSERLIPKIKSRLGNGEKVELSSGLQIRDFMDVAQVGQIIAKIALGSKVGPINICSGISVSVRQIAEKVADEFGRRDLLDFNKYQDKTNSHRFIVGVPNFD